MAEVLKSKLGKLTPLLSLGLNLCHHFSESIPRDESKASQ